MTDTQKPRVGVGVFILKNNKILLGLRKGSHGEGTWAPPGGHLEFGESLEYCAQREVLEETGLVIKNIRKLTFTNDIFEAEQKHYITCFLVADYAEGELVNLEPEKCEKWDWFEWDSLPRPLFPTVKSLLKENINLENY